MREQVLDVLFPTDVASRAYAARFVLRYSDPDSQIVLFLYPGGNADLVRYGLAASAGKTVSEIAAQMLQKNPNTDPKDIAAKFRVKIERSPLDQSKLREELEALRKLRFSPYPETFEVVDQRFIYDYWFDASGGVVHYSFFGPFKKASADDLVRWMLNFRDDSR